MLRLKMAKAPVLQLHQSHTVSSEWISHEPLKPEKTDGFMRDHTTEKTSEHYRAAA
jgi:hypothetical protein